MWPTSGLLSASPGRNLLIERTSAILQAGPFVDSMFLVLIVRGPASLKPHACMTKLEQSRPAVRRFPVASLNGK
jgi:hypothetical protein